jgi:hypothetical protein
MASLVFILIFCESGSRVAFVYFLTLLRRIIGHCDENIVAISSRQEDAQRQ